MYQNAMHAYNTNDLCVKLNGIDCGLSMKVKTVELYLFEQHVQKI